jgi:hypothetical protein
LAIRPSVRELTKKSSIDESASMKVKCLVIFVKQSKTSTRFLWSQELFERRFQLPGQFQMWPDLATRWANVDVCISKTFDKIKKLIGDICTRSANQGNRRKREILLRIVQWSLNHHRYLAI